METRLVDKEFLRTRRLRASGRMRTGSTVPKWNLFCTAALDMGLAVRLYESASSITKYVTVYNETKRFRVRFSDHRPAQDDCDFYVGNSQTTLEDAVEALKQTFRCGLMVSHHPVKMEDSGSTPDGGAI